MALKASIFIPDISGYTEFLSSTELEHSSHIINELLKVLVDSNSTDLTLAEIEGDALLFYRTGEPLSFAEMSRQVVEMFSNFHAHLKIIERDSICQCGACQTASNLSLKFVVHYGEIQEIRISNFVKASGIDMIIAHRLMKNDVPSNEYVLITDKYFDECAQQASTTDLRWQKSSQEYPTVGTIPYQYALLNAVRDSVPPAPDRTQALVNLDERTLQVEIAAPMSELYEILVDFEKRHFWVEGLRGGEGEQPTDRLDAKHLCFFDDVTIGIVPTDREIAEDSIRFAEEFTIVDQGVTGIIDYRFERLGPEKTRFFCGIGETRGIALPKPAADGMLAKMKTNLELFKEYCEQDKD